MKPTTQTLIGALKSKDWTAANEAFGGLMQQKVSAALDQQRQTIFKESTINEDMKCDKCGKTAGRHTDMCPTTDKGLKSGRNLETEEKKKLSEEPKPSGTFPGGNDNKDKADCSVCEKLGHACPRHRDVPDLKEDNPGARDAGANDKQESHKDFLKRIRNKSLKEEKSKLECMECGKTWMGNVSAGSEPKCPKCGGYDVEPA